MLRWHLGDRWKLAAEAMTHLLDSGDSCQTCARLERRLIVANWVVYHPIQKNRGWIIEYTWIYMNIHQYEYRIYRTIVEPLWPLNLHMGPPHRTPKPDGALTRALVISRYSNVSVAAIYFSQLGLPGLGYGVMAMEHTSFIDDFPNLDAHLFLGFPSQPCYCTQRVAVNVAYGNRRAIFEIPP